MDNQPFKHWRQIDEFAVLERLGCYTKPEMSFEPIRARCTQCFHASADDIEFELLLAGTEFFDIRAKRGSAGVVDLAMHIYGLDFKDAVSRLFYGFGRNRKQNLALSYSNPTLWG
jgi:hypothetical protein